MIKENEDTIDNNEIINITAYHGTTSLSEKSIEEYRFDPGKITKREDHWLGNGVYFFPNEELAEWWAKNVNKGNKNSFPIIYKVKISVKKNRYADLDDYNTLRKFWQFLLDFVTDEEFNNNPAYILKIKEIAKIRGVFFDAYRKKHNIDVIKKTFVKHNAKYINLHLNDLSKPILNKFSKGLNICVLEPQYCVYDKNNIIEQKRIKTITSISDMEVI